MNDTEFSEQFFGIEEKLDFFWEEKEKRRVYLKLLRNLIEKYLREGDVE